MVATQKKTCVTAMVKMLGNTYLKRNRPAFKSCTTTLAIQLMAKVDRCVVICTGSDATHAKLMKTR